MFVPAFVVTVKVADAVGFGVTEPGSVQVACDGQPEILRFTLLPNPFSAVTLIVDVPVPPWIRLIDPGEAPIEKSGEGPPPLASVASASSLLPSGYHTF